MALTVSQLAKLAGVTVRTLHHYDELGLVRPSQRSQAGYRLYEDHDMQRLQQVLFFRELGFPLEEISRIVNDSAFDVRAALLMQRELLRERAERAQALLRAVDAALDALEKGKAMTKEDMFEVFGDFDVEKYDAEARERWGDTEAYKESARRTARYTKQEWVRIKDEGERIQGRLAELMESGHGSADPEVMDTAEAHRQYIERWFYSCSRAMHRGLGELYVQDPRFTVSLDRHSPGLAEFMRNAFRANAERGE
jgi:MerR family transcriptional regulator, thiopeptide resistance regulator